MISNIEIKQERCKGCNICVQICVKNVLALDKLGKVYVANEKECINCGRCEEFCPDFAIFVDMEA